MPQFNIPRHSKQLKLHIKISALNWLYITGILDHSTRYSNVQDVVILRCGLGR